MVPTQAEIRLVELKNCFVNVPRSIVALLDNTKAVSSLVALGTYYSYIARLSKMLSLSYSTKSPRTYRYQKDRIVLRNALYMLGGQEWQAQPNQHQLPTEMAENPEES